MPIYPDINVNGIDLIKTVESNTFIESITQTIDPFAPVIIYVQFNKSHTAITRRWKQWGNCYSCGIADPAGYEADGIFLCG